MADLTVQTIARAGIVDTYASAAAGGDDFANDGNTFIRVLNGSGGTIIMTVASNYTSPPTGTAQANVTVSIGAGVDKMVGPFPASGFNDGDGKCNVTYDGVTSLTIGVFSMGTTIAK